METGVLMTYGLSDVPGMHVIEFKDEDEWQSMRSNCIGGSDVGAIMGINKWKTPLSVYKDKVDDVHVDISDKAAVKRGKDLEPLIFEKYVTPYLAELGYTAVHPEHILWNEAFPWLHVNLDGIGVGQGKPTIGVEIKTVGEYTMSEWDGDDYDGIPASYYAQVQTYMAVCHISKFIVGALFTSTWAFKTYTVYRNETFIENLLKKTKDFYEINLQMKIPPAPMLSKDVEESVSLLEATTDEIVLDDSMNEDITDYLRIKAQIEELETQEKIIANSIFSKYAAGKRPSSPLHSVKFTTVQSTRLDTKRIKEECPDIYDKYGIVSKSIRKTIL